MALGAVAARSLFGRPVAISARRGEPLDLAGRTAIVTYHPSAVLRAEERAGTIEAALVADLRAAWQRCRQT